MCHIVFIRLPVVVMLGKSAVNLWLLVKMVSDVMLHWSYHHLITAGSWSRLLPQFLNHTQTLKRDNWGAASQVCHQKLFGL